MDNIPIVIIVAKGHLQSSILDKLIDGRTFQPIDLIDTTMVEYDYKVMKDFIENYENNDGEIYCYIGKDIDNPIITWCKENLTITTYVGEL